MSYSCLSRSHNISASNGVYQRGQNNGYRHRGECSVGHHHHCTGHRCWYRYVLINPLHMLKHGCGLACWIYIIIVSVPQWTQIWVRTTPAKRRWPSSTNQQPGSWLVSSWLSSSSSLWRYSSTRRRSGCRCRATVHLRRWEVIRKSNKSARYFKAPFQNAPWSSGVCCSWR